MKIIEAIGLAAAAVIAAPVALIALLFAKSEKPLDVTNAPVEEWPKENWGSE